MIKFEDGMLVLSNIFTKEDVDAINKYVEFIRNDQNERIIKLIDYWADPEEFHTADDLIALIRGENK